MQKNCKGLVLWINPARHKYIFRSIFSSPSLKITSKLLLIILLNLLMRHPHQYQLHLWLPGKGEVRPPVLNTLTWAALGYCLALACQMSREQQLLLVCIINTDLNQLVFRVCLAARADHYCMAIVSPQGTF